MILLGMFLGLLALVLLNVPIAVSLGVVALFAMAVTSGVAGLPNNEGCFRRVLGHGDGDVSTRLAKSQRPDDPVSVVSVDALEPGGR